MSTRNRGSDTQYSMRVVTRLTGLSADTIRAWERRYDAVIPARSDGNTRRYSAEDVRRLSLLKEATHRGYRIGDIARLTEEKLQSLASTEGTLAAQLDQGSVDVPRPEEAFETIRRDYLNAIAGFETRVASDLLSRTWTVFPPRDFVLEVVLPILSETGDRWERGEFTVAQEHVVTQQARNLLDSILRLSSPLRGAPKLIAATPEGQMHEFGALSGAMLAGLRGWDVLYLGAQVPASDVLGAYELSSAKVVLLSAIYKGTAREITALATSINEIAGTAETWLGIDEHHPVVGRLKGSLLLHRFEDLDIALTKHMT